ncbi:hypothetical protein J1605_002637 [Eschrichtius robustus]|uniref:Uncharacterized protein n=1 Tax=Eschrichtius robustus TaxID=9764 RepID=A0AB34HYN2_ESCRO|nr:hypothetical protein J1605_002637 [Eschrichtius robustus]
MADAASQVLLGSGLTILSQPLMYVKVLIQHQIPRETQGVHSEVIIKRLLSQISEGSTEPSSTAAHVAHDSENHMSE